MKSFGAAIAALVAASTVSAAPTMSKRDFDPHGQSDPLPGATTKWDCTAAAPCGSPMDPASQATVYTTDGGITACGYNDPNNTYTDIKLNDQTDDFIAVDADMMGSLSSGLVMNPMCGQKITVTNTKTGKTMTAPVVDKCPGCQGSSGLDMSPHLFYGLGGTDAEGHFSLSWYWA